MSDSPDLTSATDDRVAQARDIAEAPPHVQVTLRAFDQVFNKRDLENAIPELDEARTCTTREEILGRLANLLGAFPDLTVSNLCALDLGHGSVAVRFRFTGTNDGPLGADAPATGRRVEAEMLDVVQFDATGRIIGGANLSDMDSIRQQLGLAQ